MIKSKLKRFLAVVVIAALALSSASCGGAKARTGPADDSLKKVLDAKQLIIGLDAYYPPMGFIDKSGEIVGFDIDMAKEVCKRLDIELVKYPINWDKKEDELYSGNIDCIWNGMSVTPERAEAMNLSQPYLKNSLIFVVNEDSKAMGMQDLVGKTVGVQSGSSVVQELKDSEIGKDVTIEEYEDNSLLIEKLKERDVDAILIDSIAAYYFLFVGEDRFWVLSDSLSEEKVAIGFRKGDNALRNKIEKVISDMKDDGTLGKISKKWFGSDITIVK